ncbi:hypothetical protein LOC68_25005 [Blastopirellula sp. JC732]|uniref:Uncharacterized protein n=1 Tax=Blastopirellula sediminis TaxID=2894196 RepID=A0A9X1MU69_9BACT|nr:hypothetical protein [Blastopirellula sediminis]MCC9605031.1 hypothetical protein [Blastopirellula sediminis]MCC9631669.1 hypothetical protein [Blastopirellula sediminis]
MLTDRRIWLSLVSLLLFAPALSFGGDITGMYDCVGDNAGGGQYQGTVFISKSGDAYKLEWNIAGRKHQGIAILTDGVLASSWIIKQVGPGGIVVQGGVVVYKVEQNGRLSGKWVGHGGGKILTEVLTPQQRVVRNDRPVGTLAGK